MSASLTLSGGALAADGITYTFTIGGATGLITITGVTGLQPIISGGQAPRLLCASALTALNAVQAANPSTCIVAKGLLYGLVSGDYNGLHYFATGRAKMVNNLIPLLSATGYTIAGPSVGNVGSPSSAFTVTRAAGSTFNGVDTVTITAGAGDVITPSVGSPGTASVTVTPTNGLTSFTFTIKATSVGNRSVAPTNAQNWADAGSISFTVSAAAGMNAALLESYGY